MTKEQLDEIRAAFERDYDPSFWRKLGKDEPSDPFRLAITHVGQLLQLIRERGYEPAPEPGAVPLEDDPHPDTLLVPPGSRYKLNGYCDKCQREWIVTCQSGTEVTVKAFHCVCGHVTEMDGRPELKSGAPPCELHQIAGCIDCFGPQRSVNIERLRAELWQLKSTAKQYSGPLAEEVTRVCVRALCGETSDDR